jgi:hypothetical protein
MPKPKHVKSKTKRTKAVQVSANPVKGRPILTNREAVEDVIQWLYAKDALGKCDSATVAMARTLAGQLDTPGDSQNARLWAEYRETISVLVKAGEERRNEFDDILSNLEASLRHPPTK